MAEHVRLPLAYNVEGIESILRHPLSREWSLQGMGMLRTYLDADKRYRLNIWDNHYKVPNCSMIHDHPWHFRSWIIAGKLTNQRYDVLPQTQFRRFQQPTHMCQTIRTGPGGGPLGGAAHPYPVILHPREVELYGAGSTYTQQRDEIHETNYLNGTVSLNDRTERVGEDARVFWPYGEEWVDACPRPATPAEVREVCDRALRLWF